MGKAVDHLAGDHRVEHRFASMNRPDCRYQVASADTFQQIARRPSLEQGKNILVIVVGSEDQHGCRRTAALDLAGGLNAVQFGHGDVY
jgi:hypothetical protein